jgi:uncharacterized circularly permuted ATP-grasp superfamily protein
VVFEGTPQTPYGEIFTAEGHLRAPYVELARRLGTDPLRPAASAWNRLRDRPFGDDARILPVPWVLDGGEYACVVERGTAQRARALQMFFADLVLGPGRFMEATSLTDERLQATMRSHGTSLEELRALWSGHDAEEIRFVYGPDLARGPDGRWLLLEDNVGCVGGSADAHHVWKVYLEAVATHSHSLPAAVPDLQTALRKWLDRLEPRSTTGGVVALLGCFDHGDGLRSVLIREDIRQRLILEQAGVWVAERDRLHALLSQNSAGGVRAILNLDGGSQLIEDAFRCRTPSFNAPGTEILGSKALLAHTDEMISFFLREQPVIATAPTYVCEGGMLPDEQGDWVVKSADGRQGNEVFMLHGQPAERRSAICNLVGTSWPDRLFVAQRRVEPSRLLGTDSDSWAAPSAELRPVTYVVGWADVHVSARPVGKAVWGFAAHAKHNLTQGACYVPTQVLTPTGTSTLQPGTDEVAT